MINATLFNSEAWHGLTKSQVLAFEKLYEALMKGLTLSHSEVPIPTIYLETAQVPIRYILACRRLLYLQVIVQRSESELTKKVYLAQRADTSEGDFCQLVDNDREMLDIQMSDDQIAQTSPYDFKNIVKLKASQAAFKYLMSVKETKSKMDNILYLNSFKPQPYLLSQSREQSSLMLALRTRTVRDIRTDFGDMYLDKTCPLPACQETDSLSHVLTCRVLQAAGPSVETARHVQYGDVFSPCQETQGAAGERFRELLKLRNLIINPTI